MSIGFADAGVLDNGWKISNREVRTFRDSVADWAVIASGEEKLQDFYQEYTENLNSVFASMFQLGNELEVQKNFLVMERNRILDSLFFSFRKKLQMRLKEIDQELNQIELKLDEQREGNIDEVFIQKMEASTKNLTTLLNKLNA